MFSSEVYYLVAISIILLVIASTKLLRVEKLTKDAREQTAANLKEKNEIDIFRCRTMTEIDSLRNSLDVLEKEKTDGFPWLAKAYSEYKDINDEAKQKYLIHKKHPAKKAADVVKEIRNEKKILYQKSKQYEYIINYYESLFPRLLDYRDKDIDDKFIRISNKSNTETEDPVREWMTDGEYNSLSKSEKNQLALDRYKKAKSSKLDIGLRYERYVGHMYEQRGCTVKYHGILKGLDDLGIDLICKKGDYVELVQCKYWAHNKEIHENAINQLFGTTIKYYFDNYSKVSFEHAIELLEKNMITPTICTSCALSKRAKEYAKVLNVKIYENIKMNDYPMIKCNNTKSGERIYHLPFDQQYDKIVMNHGDKAFYVETVIEAERMGYRRAYRWRGN